MTRTPRPVARSWQLDAALLDGLSLAAVALDAHGVVVYANPAALDRFGSPFDHLIGGDAHCRLFAESERGAVDQVLELVRRSGSWNGELTVLEGGTTPTSAPTSWSRLGDLADDSGALLLVEGAVDLAQDPYAAGQPLGHRLRRLADVTRELLGAEDVDEVCALVTEHMMGAAGATAASVSLMTDADTLALRALRGGLQEMADRWATYPLTAGVPTAESARTGRPVLVHAAEVAERYPDLGAIAPGTGSILCLPLTVAGGRVLGAVSLSFPGRRRVTEAEHLFLRLLADGCAMSVDRIRAQREARDREDKLAFLAEVSGRLAGDLDPETTLATVAGAGVPWFADWCTIALAQDGVLRTVEVAHSEPEDHALVERLSREYAAQPGDGSYLVHETGTSLLVPELTDELLASGAQDEEHLRLLKALDLRSGLICPLRVNDRTLGVVTWVRGRRGRRFSQADKDFGDALAQRAAIAIDNAQLHSQVRTAALELQRAVLPERLEEVDGWTTTVRYLPAGRTDAGGDFYDVVPLEDGRLALFVGDVMGRGVAAASVMAQMRSAIRTLIAVNPAPTAVLAGMDRVFEALHLEQLVTMVYAVADPALDHLQVINAGHPPPVLLAADGQLEVLDHPSTLILGVGGGQRAVRSAEFRPGDRLLLYTDGLLERRAEDADTAMARLVTALKTPDEGRLDRDPDGWLAAVVDELRDPTRDDDVAALLVRRDPAES